VWLLHVCQHYCTYICSYVHNTTIRYSCRNTCTFNRSHQTSLMFPTGFCRLDFLSLRQTPHNSMVYILPKPVLYLTSRALPVALSVTCLGLLLKSKILWEPDLRWLHFKWKIHCTVYLYEILQLLYFKLIIKYHLRQQPRCKQSTLCSIATGGQSVLLLNYSLSMLTLLCDKSWSRDWMRMLQTLLCPYSLCKLSWMW
jgi:hypothetical protein